MQGASPKHIIRAATKAARRICQEVPWSRAWQKSIRDDARMLSFPENRSKTSKTTLLRLAQNRWFHHFHTKGRPLVINPLLPFVADPQVYSHPNLPQVQARRTRAKVARSRRHKTWLLHGDDTNVDLMLVSLRIWSDMLQISEN